MRSSLAIVAEQQILIESLAKGLEAVASVTKVDLGPIKTEANQRVASLRARQADADNPANPIPEPSPEAPAATTEEAKTPSATEDVTSPMGQVATEGVTPDATTSVTESGGVVLDEPLDLNEQDPTKPVQGTQTNDGAHKVEHDISSGVDNPPESGPMFPLEGGPFANAEKVGSARVFASVHLARLRIQAGIAPAQDDLLLGHAIASSKISDADIAKETATLSQVSKAASQSANPPVSRSVVPRSADGERAVPSLVSVASGVSVTPSMAVSEDELGEF